MLSRSNSGTRRFSHVPMTTPIAARPNTCIADSFQVGITDSIVASDAPAAFPPSGTSIRGQLSAAIRRRRRALHFSCDAERSIERDHRTKHGVDPVRAGLLLRVLS